MKFLKSSLMLFAIIMFIQCGAEESETNTGNELSTGSPSTGSVTGSSTGNTTSGNTGAGSIASCQSDVDCSQNQKCQGGICADKESCTISEDCTNPSNACNKTSGFCGVTCDDIQNTCRAGYSCTNGSCQVEAPTTSGGTTGVTGSTPGTTGTATGGTPANTGSATGTATGGGSAGGNGTKCSFNEDCLFPAVCDTSIGECVGGSSTGGATTGGASGGTPGQCTPCQGDPNDPTGGLIGTLLCAAGGGGGAGGGLGGILGGLGGGGGSSTSSCPAGEECIQNVCINCNAADPSAELQRCIGAGGGGFPTP